MDWDTETAQAGNVHVVGWAFWFGWIGIFGFLIFFCCVFFFPLSYFQCSLSWCSFTRRVSQGQPAQGAGTVLMDPPVAREGRGYLFTFHTEIRLMKIFIDENVLLKHLVESAWLLLINREREKKRFCMWLLFHAV